MLDEMNIILPGNSLTRFLSAKLCFLKINNALTENEKLL